MYLKFAKTCFQFFLLLKKKTLSKTLDFIINNWRNYKQGLHEQKNTRYGRRIIVFPQSIFLYGLLNKGRFFQFGAIHNIFAQCDMAYFRPPPFIHVIMAKQIRRGSTMTPKLFDPMRVPFTYLSQSNLYYHFLIILIFIILTPICFLSFTSSVMYL